MAWADYDNDGRLDFLITGSDATASPVTQLWRNTGSSFSIASASSFAGDSCADDVVSRTPRDDRTIAHRPRAGVSKLADPRDLKS